MLYFLAEAWNFLNDPIWTGSDTYLQKFKDKE